MAEEEFDNVIRGVFGEGEHVIESGGDALHQFYALTQALNDLGAEPVVDVLRSEFDWIDVTWDEPQRFSELLAADFDAAGDNLDMEVNRWADKLADFDKRAGELLVEWLTNVGLGEVRLWVFMPCHQDFARLVLGSTEDGAAAVELKVA